MRESIPPQVAALRLRSSWLLEGGFLLRSSRTPPSGLVPVLGWASMKAVLASAPVFKALGRPMFQVVIFRARVRELRLKPRSNLLKFSPLIQLRVPLVAFPAVLTFLSEDAVVAEWELLLKPAANVEFNLVIVPLSRQFNLPVPSPSAAPFMSEPVASTTCAPRPSEGGGDAVLGRQRLSRLQIHNLALCMVPRS